MIRYLTIVLLIASIGCTETKPEAVTFTTPLPSINWKAEVQILANAYTDKRVDAVQKSVDELRNEVRRIPTNSSFGIQTVSYSKPRQDLGLIDDGGSVEIVDGTDEIKALTSAVNSLPTPVDHSAEIKALTSAVNELTKQRQSAPIAATYSAAPQAPVSSGSSYSSPAAPSGPRTYGSARQAGYKTVRKTRRVAKTVYEEVPYEEKIPVAVRDVYQTIQEQVPVSVTKTRMRTEQRTRKVAKTVYVDEPYSVNVPETYVDTVMQTRTRRIKVDTEEVAMPQAVSTAAPITYSSEPECVQSNVYSAPATYAVEPECRQCLAAAPVASVMPPAFFSVAKPRNYVELPAASPVQFSTPQVFSSPQVFAAPQTFAPTPQVFASTPQVFAAPDQETQLMASVPVATASPRLRPLATATNAYSQVRKQNQSQRGGGLFQRGKSQAVSSCPGGVCPLR